MTPFTGGISCLKFTSDGRQIFVASEASIHQLDLKRQAIDNVFTDGSSSLSSFSLTDELLVSSRLDGSVGFRSLKLGFVGSVWTGSQADHGLAPCLAVHSPSAEQLLIASSSQTGIRLATLSSSSGTLLSTPSILTSNSKVTGLQFLGQGAFLNTLAACTYEGTLLLYDLRAPPAPSSVLRVSASQSATKWSFSCLDFKLGSEIMGVGSTDGRCGLFDLRSSGFKLLGSFPSSSKNPVTQIHWQPPSASSQATSRRSSLSIAAPVMEPQAVQDPQGKGVGQVKALQDATNTAKIKSPSQPQNKDKEIVKAIGVQKPIVMQQPSPTPDDKVVSKSVEASAPLLQIREDVRALHLEVLKQSHVSSEELRSLLSQVLLGQRRIEERMDRIEAKIEKRGMKL